MARRGAARLGEVRGKARRGGAWRGDARRGKARLGEVQGLAGRGAAGHGEARQGTWDDLLRL